MDQEKVAAYLAEIEAALKVEDDSLTVDKEIAFLRDELRGVNDGLMRLHDKVNVRRSPIPDLVSELRQLIGPQPMVQCQECYLHFYDLDTPDRCSHCQWRFILHK